MGSGCNLFSCYPAFMETLLANNAIEADVFAFCGTNNHSTPCLMSCLSVCGGSVTPKNAPDRIAPAVKSLTRLASHNTRQQGQPCARARRRGPPALHRGADQDADAGAL